MPLLGDRKPFPLLTSPFREDEARFSPDAKWIAYQSDENGRSEIYVMPFHAPSEDGSATQVPTRSVKWQVSTQGGTYPHWRSDGKEIFFLSMNGKLTAAEITLTAEGVEIGPTTELFSVDQVGGVESYDAAADGQWFVLNSSTVQKSSSISLITNWDADLTQP
jgi:Tol biopolymer transport system component